MRPDRPSGFDRLLLLCRPGFEGDAAAEMMARLAEDGLSGYCRTAEDQGWLECFPQGTDPLAWLRGRQVSETVFIRQWCATGPCVEDLDPADRLSPLAARLVGHVADVLVETPDGDATRDLAKLGKRLLGPMKGLLQKDNRLRPTDLQAPRLHLVLASGASAWLGLAPGNSSSPQPGGVVRLRHDPRAPSRSALKLEEGLRVMLGEAERLMAFPPRCTAVDLGAAPGGWTWVLRQHGVHVYAVDNGRLDEALFQDEGVIHERADAFTWQPPRNVNWLVCDVVDKPARVVELMARWLRRGWADRAIFNLKLPMKRRWHAVADARERFFHRLGDAAGGHELHMRQLYHDREEITCVTRPARS